ncbi:MAG: hypothetical protein HC836_41190 [Richelia sp. RM2_1_2]|nr:hypothetical protein [Richelia sp. RM2_1_2]
MGLFREILGQTKEQAAQQELNLRVSRVENQAIQTIAQLRANVANLEAGLQQAVRAENVSFVQLLNIQREIDRADNDLLTAEILRVELFGGDQKQVED